MVVGEGARNRRGYRVVRYKTGRGCELQWPYDGLHPMADEQLATHDMARKRTSLQRTTHRTHAQRTAHTHNTPTKRARSPSRRISCLEVAPACVGGTGVLRQQVVAPVLPWQQRVDLVVRHHLAKLDSLALGRVPLPGRDERASWSTYYTLLVAHARRRGEERLVIVLLHGIEQRAGEGGVCRRTAAARVEAPWQEARARVPV